jgi:hypothetical protein
LHERVLGQPPLPEFVRCERLSRASVWSTGRTLPGVSRKGIADRDTVRDTI